MIEIMDNGEVNPKLLTKEELACLVDIKLNHYKRHLQKLEEKRNE